MRRKQYTSATEKWVELGSGVVGCVVVNVIVLFLREMWLPPWISWVINLGVIGLLVFFRPYIALGWLVALGTLLALETLLTVFVLVFCFAMMIAGGSIMALTGNADAAVVVGLIVGVVAIGLAVVGAIYLVRLVVKSRKGRKLSDEKTHHAMSSMAKTVGEDSEAESLPEQTRERH